MATWWQQQRLLRGLPPQVTAPIQLAPRGPGAGALPAAPSNGMVQLQVGAAPLDAGPMPPGLMQMTPGSASGIPGVVLSGQVHAAPMPQQLQQVQLQVQPMMRQAGPAGAPIFALQQLQPQAQPAQSFGLVALPQQAMPVTLQASQGEQQQVACSYQALMRQPPVSTAYTFADPPGAYAGGGGAQWVGVSVPGASPHAQDACIMASRRPSPKQMMLQAASQGMPQQLLQPATADLAASLCGLKIANSEGGQQQAQLQQLQQHAAPRSSNESTPSVTAAPLQVAA